MAKLWLNLSEDQKTSLKTENHESVMTLDAEIRHFMLKRGLTENGVCRDGITGPSVSQTLITALLKEVSSYQDFMDLTQLLCDQLEPAEQTEEPTNLSPMDLNAYKILSRVLDKHFKQNPSDDKFI